MNLKQLIDLEAKETPSGACIARSMFASCRAVKFPVGYAGTAHQDGAPRLVYHLEDHPSGLLIGGKRIETRRGRLVYIPDHQVHQIEEVTDRPRYSIVMALA